jgi:subtilisin family serine protease
MRTFARSAAIFVASLFLCAGAFAQAGPPPAKAQIIVKFAPGLSDNDKAASIARSGGTERARINQLGMRIIEVPAAQADAVLAKYAADANVKRAERSRQRQTDRAPVDPLYGSQWGLPKIGWDQVFASGRSPAGSATVAVLDTGIDASHPDLAGQVVAGTSILDGSSGMTDPNGHGTWVAGIIAARSDNNEGIAGVGFAGVRVMPVTVLDSSGLGQDGDVIAGIVWAADQGAAVIVMAFSNPGFSQSLQDAIDYAWSKGAVLVAAAGNDAAGAATFPAGDRGVIGAAATDESDQRAAFSNTGQAVFLAAPGVNIQSAAPAGYAAGSGTSASAAFIAGAAALLKATDGGLTNGVIVGRLARTADPAGTTPETGNGRLNLDRALADSSTESIQPAGADPVGAGGPFVGPYSAASGLVFMGLVSPQQGTATYSIVSSVTFNVQFVADTNPSGPNPIIVTPTLSVVPPNTSWFFSPANVTVPGNFQPVNTTLTIITSAATPAGALPFTIANSFDSRTANGSLTVFKASSSTFITTNLAVPTVVGQPYTVPVTVTNAIGPGPSPSGVVLVSDGTSSCSVNPLSSGSGSCVLTSTSTGNPKTITATYQGDGNYSQSSTNAAHPVSKAGTSISITNAAALATPTVFGQSYTVSFSVSVNSPGVGTPTGNVTVTDGSQSCTTTVATGQCQLGSNILGTRTITANYLGDANFNSSGSVPASHQVNPRSTTTGVICVPSSIVFGVPTTCTATVTDSSPGIVVTPFGQVQFNASGAAVSPSSATCTLSGSGSTATCSALFIGNSAGSISVLASFVGNAIQQGSGSTTGATVGPRFTATTVSCSGGPLKPGLNATSICSISVTDTSGGTITTPTGTVNLIATGAGASLSTATCTLSGTGATAFCPSVSVSVTAGGTATVTATYAGDGMHLGSGGGASITVNKRTTGTSLSCSSFIVGVPTPCTATVTDTDGGTAIAPGGSVTFSATGPVSPSSTSCTLSGPSCSVTLTASGGPVSIVSAYQGDAAHLGSSASASFQVLNAVTITASAGTGGTINPSGTATWPPGTTPTYTIAPSSGFRILDVRVDNVSVGAVGSYTFSPLVVGHTISATFRSNTKPSAADRSVVTNEDQAVGVTLSGSDAETAAANLTYTIVAAPLHGTLSGTAPNLIYTPAANYNGPDSFRYTVTDRGEPDSCTSGSGCNAPLASDPAIVGITVNAANDAPVANAGTVSTTEDTPVTFTLTATDVDSTPLTFSIVGAPAHGSLSIGAVTCSTVSNATLTPGSNCSAQVTYTPALNYNSADDGAETFTFKVSDGSVDSPVATVAITVTAVNDSPANLDVTASASTLNEGDALTLSGSFSDPDKDDPHTVTIDWGDGTPSTTIALAPGTFTFSVTHAYRDDNPTATALDLNAISVIVRDGAGAVASANGSVTVGNLTPVVGLATGPAAPMQRNSSATIVVPFTDAGVQDTHTCLINWDDGTTTAGTVTETNGSGTCTGTRTYANAGVYEVFVTIVDDDGGIAATSYRYVVIYDPNGGFVTGGGWIASPAGAYAINPVASGKANFGFVSKYVKGANVPAGETEFQFKAGDFNFKSTVYEWLVIAGARAQYKGSGAINGSGDYGFLLTAIDGQVNGGGGLDRFRIKVWNKATSAVIYDNAPGSDDLDTSNTTVVSGGSVTIHK